MSHRRIHTIAIRELIALIVELAARMVTQGGARPLGVFLTGSRRHYSLQ